MMKVYFIRHGRTLANVTYTYAGFTDTPLSEEGVRLLEEQRAAGGYPDTDGLDVYTSGLSRTKDTLRILFGNVPHSVDPDFREMNFGIFEGHSYEELKDRADYQEWISGDHMSRVCPGGESGTMMTERALKALDRVLEKGRDALIVTHGGVIATIFLHYFPDTELNWYEIQPVNGEGYLFEFGEDRSVRWSKIPVPVKDPARA